MRRRARVVLWGGRPNLDIQVGSAADRIRQRRLKHKAAYHRLARTLRAELNKLGIVAERAARIIANALTVEESAVEFMANGVNDDDPYTWRSADPFRASFIAEYRAGSQVLDQEWPVTFPPTSPGGCRHPASALASLDFGACPGWTRCADCQTVLTPDQSAFIRRDRQPGRRRFPLLTGLTA